MVRRIVFILLVTVLLAAGCSADDDTGSAAEGVDLGDVTLAAALAPFASCDALLDHLRTEALERVGPYGLYGEGYYGPVAFDEFAEADTAAAEEGTVRTEAPVPTSTVPTSGTNTQEAFVDEPDIVKVTADRMVLVDDDVLRIVDLTSDQPVARGTVRLPGWGQQILVVGDRVLALGSNEEAYYAEDAATTWAPYGAISSILSEIDISDPDNPTIVHSLEVDSAYLSARLVGETARVVVSATHPAFPFVYPSGDSPEARAIAEEANRRVIEEATLQDWLPGATLDDEAVDAVDCAAVQRPEDFSGFGFLSVLTVDLTQPLAVPPSATVLADGQTVYASTESLYVATSRPQPVVAPDDPGPSGTTLPHLSGEAYETALHRFDITGTGAATYVASGVVAGHLVDQFSLSEHEGRLRVATTEGAPWSSSEQAASRVAVLETDGQALVEVGAVEGLGRTEQIYSVRFLGDTAYVVTFRQTDPLFVVDLSDPTAPVLRGDLESPGYSAYLHPIDEGHLLGIGQDADADGMTRGLQASVFDVTDPTHPTRVDRLVFPGMSSAVEWDHHAFLYWGATGQAVLPLTFAQSIVLSVGPDHVDEQGRIDLPNGQEVRRNIVVGDHLLTLGADTLVTSSLSTLQPLSELAL